MTTDPATAVPAVSVSSATRPAAAIDQVLALIKVIVHRVAIAQEFHLLPD